MIRLVFALLLALAFRVLAATAPYDPFRPAPPALDRTRLHRAGLDPNQVDALADEYEQLDYAQRYELNRWIASQPDEVIRDRYAQQQQTVVQQPPAVEEQQGGEEQPAGENAQAATVTGGEEQPAPAGPTYEELNAETIDQLDERIRQWNAAHPDGPHLAIAGRKGEKIGRLLDAYSDGEQEPAAPAAPEATSAPADTPAPADATVPTAPTPTSTDGTPAEATPTPDAAGAGITDTTGGTPS